MTFESRRKVIDEFIEGELGDYLNSDEYKIERSDCNGEETIEDGVSYEYYTLEANFNNKNRTVELKIDENEKIEVDLSSEGYWYKTVEYDRTVKYFWMAFLD